MKIAIIKYNAGNVQSVIYALQRFGLEPELTDDVEYIQKADKVIFPGQGEASSAIRYLKSKKLDELIVNLKQPVLGICIGLQLMCSHSEEGNTPCLGIFKEKVKKFPPQDKVPHIGWNTLETKEGVLLKDLREEAYLYYVHSYYAEVGEDTVGETNYILPFSAVMEKNNFYAIQAHPEKSGKDGEVILKNFLDL
ncbi:imidazole glycerol phosphate synthase subunit HisH [Catalinimonas niigatensis]|uniref:imidazole glycerol phosphate synthase subunit HisH n=1 Tax=Catalinimonas niigatensis TaxID=1397264 RepID=UPI0026667773|nr:imidazole glycerol phosphate synthase subunit HisH [Catalinimonas niigatensis]WPP51098.1 imidazole glycerol phosphate synthase subunit HisH [Catalinimonas niigatensis]